MYVRLSTSLGDAEELAKIVDAVVRTYMSDVVGAELRSQSVVRDALAKSYQKLSKEIARKMENYFALSKEIGVSDGTTRDPESELLLHEITEATRHQRELERRLAELQTEFLVAEQQTKKSDNQLDLEPFRKEHQIRAGVLNQQLSQLNKLVEEKSEKFISRGRESVDLKVRQAELTQLQELASKMTEQLEKLDVESILPDRVRVIQWAM
jgi:hypothetical protein